MTESRHQPFGNGEFSQSVQSPCIQTRVAAGFLTYPFLANLFADIPLQNAYGIMEGMHALALGERGSVKIALLSSLVENEHGYKIPEDLAEEGYQLDQVGMRILLQEVVHAEAIAALLPFLWRRVFEKEDLHTNEEREPVNYKLLLSFLVAGISSGNLPQELAAVVGELPQNMHHAIVFPFDERSRLCGVSEGKWEKAMKPGIYGTVLVDNRMLVKVSKGKTVGICLESFAGGQGVFVQGGCYSPIGNVQEQILQAYEYGDTFLTTSSEGEWLLLRPVGYLKNLLEGISPQAYTQMLRDYSKTVPANAPLMVTVNGIQKTRRQLYREQKQ